MFRDRSLLIAEIPHLRRYARALCRDPDTADDLVQRCLERALKKFHLWQTDRRLRPWLFTIMYNLHVDMIRETRFSGKTVGLGEVPELSQPARQEDHVNLTRVLAAIDALPREQRDVLVLVGVRELSYADAAKVLSIPLGTLMSRLNRGRERLRQTLGMEKKTAVLRKVK
ncbi:sigma-70 family RNA polymerase sigma factor [Salipiger sp. P9]|uniref:sigma-70 family RNA polymerase sigma factor n=1 Tax=Salipiger pentaromativorans TaxID=2943193 RepID=UPI0021587406|nr:sigma-70 family RNA polymerase sigma factor [Salipiger pentaromativorans]MCR8546757.1 sigma-70 family RNA polymerase sigma factor [Salipiger pentaromativorans]